MELTKNAQQVLDLVSEMNAVELNALVKAIEEKFGVSENHIEHGLKISGINTIDFMTEGSKWFLLENNQLSPGRYKIKHAKVLSSTLDDIVREKDWIVVGEDAYPIGTIFGLNIYEVKHKSTNQNIYITVDELLA